MDIRQTYTNGNEGVGIKLDCLERAYGMKYFVIDKVNGDINAIHDERPRAHRI